MTSARLPGQGSRSNTLFAETNLMVCRPHMTLEQVAKHPNLIKLAECYLSPQAETGEGLGAQQRGG